MMKSLVQVRDVEGLPITVDEILRYTDEVFDACNRRLGQVERLEAETVREVMISRGLLAEARIREAAALAHLQAVIAGLPESAPALPPAQRAYDAAVKHRKNMERRVEIAEKAQRNAQELLSDLKSDFGRTKSEVEDIANNGKGSLRKAYDTLKRYQAETPPEIKSAYEDWSKHKETEDKKVEFEDIRRRLQPTKQEMMGFLGHLVAVDHNIADLVDKYRFQYREKVVPRQKIETAIRRYLVGTLAEAIVVHAFEPYVNSVVTQDVTDLPESNTESFTKTDVKLFNFKVPVIMGRGKYGSVQEGSSLAIEVKTGSPEYINAQRNHILNQIKGHSDCDVSRIICSKDFREIARQADIREEFREKGSPVFAVLPYKKDMDDTCIEFVLGGSEGV